MDDQTHRTLDLARALIQLGDVETVTQNLLACLFASSVLQTTPPMVTIETLREYLMDEEAWDKEIYPALIDPEFPAHSS